MKDGKSLLDIITEILSDVTGEDTTKRYNNEVADSEEYQVVKNNVKTTVKLNFNKYGYLLNVSAKSDYQMTDNEKKIIELKKELDNAVRNKEYRKAADIEDQIKELVK